MIWALLACVLFAPSVFPLELKWDAGRKSVTVRSVQDRKTTFVNLADVEGVLPVTVRRDSSAGLIVLCTEVSCTPVFQLDHGEYLRRGGEDFIRANLVTNALGCKTQIRKDEASLDCAQPPDRLRKVGSSDGDVAPGIRNVPGDRTKVIAFVRSLDWDPFSITLVRRLQNVQDSLLAADAHVVVIHGYGEKQGTMWHDSLKVSLPLLADDATAMMRAYHVFDRGSLPRPSVFVVDQAGIIRLRKVFDDLSVPPDISNVIAAVARIR